MKKLKQTGLLFAFSTITLGTTMAQTDEDVSYLALGDSYTICQSIDPEQRWPVQLQRKLADAGIAIQDPKIIARTGWRTDDMLSAAKKELTKEQFDLVSLLIGVNNEFQGQSPKSFEPEFKKSLEYAIKHCKHGKAGVFVVSIPDYGYTPYGKAKQAKISERLDQYNEICERLAKQFEVPFYNITALSRAGLKDASLVAKDGLHPSAKQYQQWVDSFAEDVINLVKGF